MSDFIKSNQSTVEAYRANHDNFAGCVRMLHDGPAPDPMAERVGDFWVCPYAVPAGREVVSVWSWCVIEPTTGLSVMGGGWHKDAARLLAETLPSAADCLAASDDKDSPIHAAIKAAKAKCGDLNHSLANSGADEEEDDELSDAEEEAADLREELEDAERRVASIKRERALRAKVAADNAARAAE